MSDSYRVVCSDCDFEAKADSEVEARKTVKEHAVSEGHGVTYNTDT